MASLGTNLRTWPTRLYEPCPLLERNGINDNKSAELVDMSEQSQQVDVSLCIVKT